MVAQRHLELALWVPLESHHKFRREPLLRNLRLFVTAARSLPRRRWEQHQQRSIQERFQLSLGSDQSAPRRSILLDAGLHRLQRHKLRERESSGPWCPRNSLTGPGYRDVDITLAKSFGLPNMRVLGEGAKFEFRMDAFNLFNNLNFNPTSISNNIANSNFGTAQSALAGRVVTLSARFSF